MEDKNLFTDQNKTGLTHRITASVVLYLYRHGFKPVATEVPLCAGWCADVAGVVMPTPTEAVNLKLVGRKPRNPEAADVPPYLEGHAAEEMSEWRRSFDEWAKAYDSLPSPLSALVEVKVSRSDFRQDWKWQMKPPANLCYLAIPKGMLRPEEYPAGWFILESAAGGALRIARRGQVFELDAERQLRAVLAVAVRLDNSVRYSRENLMRKMQRAEDGQRRARSTAHAAMLAMVEIVRGSRGSVDEVLAIHRLTGAAKHIREDLERLWGVGVGCVRRDE